MIEIRVTQPVEIDRRYRVLVLLERSDRPTHYTWHCPRCTRPLVELVNTEVRALSDVMDISNIALAANGVRCDSRYQGRRCDIWYYFSLT